VSKEHYLIKYIYFFKNVHFAAEAIHILTPQETKKNETDTAQFKKDKDTHKKEKRARSIYTIDTFEERTT